MTAPVLVRSGYARVSNGSFSDPIPVSLATTAAGNALIAAVFGWGSSNFAAGNCTDNRGNTYALDAAFNAGSLRIGFYSCLNPTSGAGATVVTVTNAALIGKSMGVAEVQNLLTSAAFDKSTSNGATSASLSSGTTATLSQADEFVMALATIDASANAALTETGGFALIGESENGTNDQVGSVVYKIVAATTALAATWTWAGGTDAYGAAIVTYKATGGGVPTLVVADCASAHAADNVGLTGGVPTLVVADGTHAHAADNVAINVPGANADNFNRADGGLGANWAPGGTAMTIVSNQAHPPNGVDSFERFENNLGSPDHFAEVDVFFTHGSDYMVLDVRRVSTAVNSDCYQGFLNPDGTHVEIGRNSGGSYTTLVKPTATFDPGTPPNKLRLEAQGSAIRLYLNGVLVASVTDTTLPTGNYTGLNSFASSSSWFDNFQCGLITTTVSLTVADAAHAHAAANVGLALAGNVQDAVHAHTADTVTLIQAATLVVQSAVHDHTSPQVSFFSGTYPVARSGRKWIDQRGNVYLWKTFASWSMSQHLTNAQITTALQGVANLGFTCVTVAPWGVNKQSSDNTPLNNAAGQAFWTGAPISSAMGPAWSSMDWVMAEAQRLNLTVAFSIFLSYGGTGTTIHMINAGVTACYNYGVSLVNRYPASQYPNVIWHVMADFQFDYGADPSTQLDAIFHGIRDAETAAGGVHHLLLAEPSQPGNSGYRQWISQEGPSGYRWCLLDANSFYEYKDDSVVQFDAIYNQVGATSYPVVDVEPPYVNSGNFGGNFNQQMRERVLSDYIRGSIGINFSNEYWWPMTKTGDLTPAVPFSTVMASLTDTAVVQAGYAQSVVDLVKDVNWLPDTGSFLTAGLGAGDTKAAAGLSGTVAMAYFPTSRTVTVDTSVMIGSGPVRLRWYDPTTGAFTLIAASEAQTFGRTVTYPGAHADGMTDWLLVVDLADLFIADATHSHKADNVGLLGSSSLTPNDAVHAHTADNLPLLALNSITPADAIHAHSADVVALVQQNTLVVADCRHDHIAASFVLTAGGVLAVQDAVHAHAAAAVVLLVTSAVMKVWNGTAYVNGTVRVWNGSAFVTAGSVKTWNGSGFV